MRNIIEYPITDEEIDDFLNDTVEDLLNLIKTHGIMGSLDIAIVREIQRRLANNS